jgi:two-component sensor histidine kinase
LPSNAIRELNYKLEQHDVALRERYQELNHKLEQHDVALRESEERLAGMAAELQHRTRNLISVVGAMADNTMKTSSTFEDFKASYHAHLEALARAQGLLFRMQKGDRVTFDELLNTELAAQSVRVGEMDRSRSMDRKAFDCAPAQSRRSRWSCTSW